MQDPQKIFLGSLAKFELVLLRAIKPTNGGNFMSLNFIPDS